MGQGNASYWEDRAERLLKAREAMTAEQQQILADALQAAQREIEAGIEKFCRRYAKNNKVTYAQAQKALSLKELARFRGNLPAFRKLAKAHIGEFRLEVDNLSAKAQITRLQALKAEIDAALQRAYLQMEKGIEAGSLAVYDDQYHRSLFAMDRYAGFRHQYVGIDQDGIKAVMQYPFNGLDYSTRIWRQRDDLSYKLQSTLNTMLITGEPPDKYAEEFARIFKAKEQEAHRLLYTENAYVAEQAKLQAYRDTGVGEYEILATLDAKTSAICREQDGRQYPIGEEKPGTNFPPFHPWCRTVTIPAVKGFSGEGMTRAARDPKTGKTIPVPASMTYGEWKSGLREIKGSAILNLSESEEYAVNRYIGSESYSLNAKLREGVPLTDDETSWVRELDAALEHLPVYQGTVYRSLNSDAIGDIEAFWRQHTVGQMVRYPAYTSTGTEVYDATMDIQLVIQCKTGRDIRRYNSMESEILYQRGKRFYIEKKEGDTLWMIEI